MLSGQLICRRRRLAETHSILVDVGVPFPFVDGEEPAAEGQHTEPGGDEPSDANRRRPVPLGEQRDREHGRPRRSRGAVDDVERPIVPAEQAHQPHAPLRSVGERTTVGHVLRKP